MRTVYEIKDGFLGASQEIPVGEAAPAGWTFTEPPKTQNGIAIKWDGEWVLVDESVYKDAMAVTQAKALQSRAELLNQAIDTERTARIAAGMPYAFPDGTGGTVQLRHERDILNVNAVGTAAMMITSAGDTATKMEFRDQEDVTHQMSAPEMLAMAQDVMGWISAHYAAAWTHKDAIKELVEAADGEGVASYDITQGWPS